MSVAVANSTINRFDRKLAESGLRLERAALEVLQVNVGRLCNQTCTHCHVSAGPWRKEIMQDDIADLCIGVLDAVPTIHTLDITGGAPEMTPVFRKLARAGRERGLHVIDRCNLTILVQPGFEDLAGYLASLQVHIIASLPCYTMENVDRQRGEGAFEQSIAALKLLNSLGYGMQEGDSALRLDLVYNPLGPSLPPSQAKLEADYRHQLRDHFGIVFDHLLAFANLPVGRFRSDLKRQRQLNGYMDLLEASFNPRTIEGLMCRTFLSVDHEGYLYDCDFNQMLGLPLGGEGRKHLRDLDAGALRGLAVATGDHCLGCSAGCGSSCAGALA